MEQSTLRRLKKGLSRGGLALSHTDRIVASSILWRPPQHRVAIVVVEEGGRVLYGVEVLEDDKLYDNIDSLVLHETQMNALECAMREMAAVWELLPEASGDERDDEWDETLPSVPIDFLFTSDGKQYHAFAYSEDELREMGATPPTARRYLQAIKQLLGALPEILMHDE